MDKTTASQGEVLRDFAELVAKAFLGGLGVAIAMAAAILALSPAAQAAISADDPMPDEPKALEARLEGTGFAEPALFLVSEPDDEPRSVAPAPTIEQPSAGTGALWANEADAPATLQFVAACMALAMAGGVTLVGRRMA